MYLVIGEMREAARGRFLSRGAGSYVMDERMGDPGQKIEGAPRISGGWGSGKRKEG